MSEAVQTGGLMSFSYDKSRTRGLSREEKQELEEAYERYYERKDKEKKKKKLFWIIIAILLLIILISAYFLSLF